ncbi:hypothetical protein [Microbacterium tumbae]
MNRTIAAWTIAAVAVLGLTACSGTPSASDDTASDDTTSEETTTEETTTDQSVADACALVTQQVTDATSDLSTLDISAASSDPQGFVDDFTATVDAIGAAADSVSNEEVKTAATAIYEDFGELRDLLSKVLIDGDTSVASELSTISTDVTESATALSTLCAG